ncbi:MAG TPA: transglycosylase SLT domain-containing protein [Pyrinomonadaceae bacterium]|nr:transglycosylase SLT domain-containing protein [Pyrinomonadaceae bacterium]
MLKKIVAALSLSLLVTIQSSSQSARDTTLSNVRQSDAAGRSADGSVPKLTPAEHMRRASVYLGNRAFAEARAHWQALLDNYPEDPRAAEAMLGIGRSYFLSKVYQDGYVVFNELVQKYPGTKEAREGLNYSAASLLRMGKFSESAARYEEYITRYPNGERIDTAHLNMIDTLREANRPADAMVWVTKTRQRFAGSATETNAMFGALRLHVAEQEWSKAVAMADQLSQRTFAKAVLTSRSEVAYLKAFSLEQDGRKNEAFAAYLAVPDSIDSYYGWLASQRLTAIAGKERAEIVAEREGRVNSAIAGVADTYPAPYRQAIVSAAKARKLDPRFILALMRQESVFKPFAKSPAGARGLLQLTLDTAQKYAPAAGFNSLRENQLYQPETSIMLGAEYLEHLTQMFPDMLEPIAASYNGGEDNVARWLERAGHKDRGVFTAEIGFDETKGYVQKVMSNYRVYRQLYTVDLIRR